MTAKRFKLRLSQLGNGMITDIQKREDLYFDKEFLDATLPKVTEWLNTLNEENEQLKEYNNKLMKQPLLFDVQTIPNTMEIMEANTKLEEENEQLKARNENQYNQLTELWEIIEEEKWEKLIVMKKQLKEDEEQLQREWRTYE